MRTRTLDVDHQRAPAGAHADPSHQLPAADDLDALGTVVAALAQAAGIATPRLVVTASDAALLARPARTGRHAAVVVGPAMLGASEAQRELALARAVAGIAGPSATLLAVAGLLARSGVRPLAQMVASFAGDADARRGDLVAQRLLDAVHAGVPARAAVPYRDFVKT